MKHKYLLGAVLLLLLGCNQGASSNSSFSSSSSSSTSSIFSESIASSSNFSSDSSSNSIQTSSTSSQTSNSSISSSGTTSISSSSSSSISSSSSNSSLEVTTINNVLTKGNLLSEGETGELVRVQATYIKTLTWSRSNEDVMVIVDNTGMIGFRLAYSDYSNYFSFLDTNLEYSIIGNVAKNNNRVELIINQDYKNERCFSLIGTSVFDATSISSMLPSILDLVNEFDQVGLNNKKYGLGKIVTVTAQLVAIEYSNTGKKALFSDGELCFTVVSDSRIARESDIGTIYKVTGIMSVEVTSPALWYLKKEIVTQSDTINVSNAFSTTAESFKKYSILQDNYKNPSYLEYMTLYQTTGYIRYDSGRTSKYYLGLVDTPNGSLNDVGSNLISGLFLLNNQGLDERGLTYSPFYDYVDSNETITLYYSLNQFDSSNHGWKAFAIETLV